MISLDLPVRAGQSDRSWLSCHDAQGKRREQGVNGSHCAVDEKTQKLTEWLSTRSVASDQTFLADGHNPETRNLLVRAIKVNQCRPWYSEAGSSIVLTQFTSRRAAIGKVGSFDVEFRRSERVLQALSEESLGRQALAITKRVANQLA